MIVAACLAGSLGGCAVGTSGTPAAVSPGSVHVTFEPSASPPVESVAGCVGDTTAITSCLQHDLATFWSGELDTAVDEPVVLSPRPTAVPADCRPGLALATAFTCPVDSTMYVTAPFIRKIDAAFPPAGRSQAWAVVQAHEMGHVVQFAVHQPQLRRRNSNLSDTRFVEQQADCLSGVWARHQADAGRLDRGGFVGAAVTVLRLISTPAEIRTHGAVITRLRAIDRGFATGRPQSCRLATFH